MSNPPKKYPFNDREFQFRLTGVQVKGCTREPSCFFNGTNPDAKNPGIVFNGYFNYTGLEKNPYQYFSYLDFRFFLSCIRAIANMPGTEPVSSQLAFNYRKGDTWNRNGISVTIKRRENGVICFAFKNKDWPIIPFNFLPRGTVSYLTADGTDGDLREASKAAAFAFCEEMTELANRHKAQTILAEDVGGVSNTSTVTTEPADNADLPDDDIPF